MLDRLSVTFEPHHQAVADEAARVANTAIEPIEQASDCRNVEDEDALAHRYAAVLADAGLLRHVAPDPGILAPRFDSRSICLVREQLARASGFADCIFIMQGLGTGPITLAGTPEQRQRWIPPVRSGKALAAFAITEPEAGSDVASLTSRATRTGDHYVLSGMKTFISNAGVASSYVVFAKTAPDAGPRGISAFLVPADTPGLRIVERQRVIAPHPIGTLAFDDCRVPVSSRLGAEGDGFKLAMKTLDVFRVSVGAAAIGLARRALAEAISRAKTRVQFKKPIGQHQAIQFYLADMATDLEAAQLLVYRAATLADKGLTATTREASMAKMTATESAQRIIDKAVQIHGGSGVLCGSIVERLYREIRALRIYEGTTEIQHIVIGRGLLDDDVPRY